MAGGPQEQVRHEVRALIARMNHALRESRDARTKRSGGKPQLGQWVKGAAYSAAVRKYQGQAGKLAHALRRRAASSHSMAEGEVWARYAYALERSAAPSIVDAQNI